jgi:hypothetical protein
VVALGGEADGWRRYAGRTESGASAARFGSRLIGMNRWWDPRVSHVQANGNGVGGTTEMPMVVQAKRQNWARETTTDKSEQLGLTRGRDVNVPILNQGICNTSIFQSQTL